MIDINSPSFIQDFKLSDGTVGLIGHGYVNKAVEAFFTVSDNKPGRIVIYDKFAPELGTLADVVGFSEVIFVAVPTPMRKDGSCHTGIVESVFADIRREAERQERSTDSFVIVLKSTVPVGFTAKMQQKNPDLRIIFSPEFLTEKNYIADFVGSNRMIFGGEQEDVIIVSKFVADVFPQKVADDRLLLIQCNPSEAEMVKLFSNGILATKVAFCNDIFQLCKKLGVDYDEVRKLSALDRRIGGSHTQVPGPDGHLGFGGHCFPKDLRNLQALAREAGVVERLFTAVIDRNNELRDDKDWEEMKGRAVIDE